MKRTSGTTTKLRSLAVSDHRPVWAVFSIKIDDDGNDEGGSVSVSMPASESTEPEPEPSEDGEVYVTRTGKKYHREGCSTRTGKKYHREGCSSLRRSKIPISLAEAKDSGMARVVGVARRGSEV